MNSLLEITGDDIALLNDSDLRSLIGLLSEADFRVAGLSTNGIVWSGHQDAPDDGVDVKVHSDFDPPPQSWIPRKHTIFQVKKPNMQPAKITDEMKPRGELREEIKMLIAKNGAYIIVNSVGSTTNKALRSRISAMKNAVSKETNSQNLYLDFFDQGRIATWVRTHPSMILWVRNKIERPLQGWQPYANWSNKSIDLSEEYIIDEKIRLYADSHSNEDGSFIHGLEILRLRLSQRGASVRLIGVSGVGKTRLVQALFDDRFGNHVLNSSLAYYTDISHNPNPDPLSFASQLIAMNTQAILIVDNCSAQLHSQLTTLCKNSHVALLTVEYDIRDDLPEETNVFRLEASSDVLIEKLLARRYPHISQINQHTVAEFAGGNARVAIALANTLERHENVSTLKDSELFNRLFHQHHAPNQSLKISAEICSLVYSFDGEDTTPTSELTFLARLADKSSHSLYRDIGELRNRGLIQSRSIWRAVLPHAIANRLAKEALNSIPIQTILTEFLSHAPERLLVSFTRRIGYLHDCEHAVKIAQTWLEPNGLLGRKNCDLSNLWLNILTNIAPLAPNAVLAMLERAALNDDGLARLQKHDFTNLLRHIAYETELFERSTRLLCRIAVLEKLDINSRSDARNILAQLFRIVLSGTRASAHIRVRVVNEMIYSNHQIEQELGMMLLKSALQTFHFTTSHTHTFGARARDFGYYPKTYQEQVNWYRTFLTIGTEVAVSDTPLALSAKRVFANELRGLWRIGASDNLDLLDELERCVLRIHTQKPWNEGWIALRGIIRYDGQQMEQKILLRLNVLDRELKPNNLLEQARTYALTDQFVLFNLEDDIDDEEVYPALHRKRIYDTTKEIGVAVAQNEFVFNELLPELVSSYSERLHTFGEGIADGCVDRQHMWQTLYDQVTKTPPEKRQITFMLGFLASCANHEPELYNSILDSLVKDQLLGLWFPYFQLTSTLDQRGIERLQESLDEGTAHPFAFKQLALGRRHEAISDDNLALLLQKLLSKENGTNVVIDILRMRFYEQKDETIHISPNLLVVSRKTLLQYNYQENQTRNNNQDYELARIADIALHGHDGIQTAQQLCELLAEGFRQCYIHFFSYPKLLEKLAKTQSMIFLSNFIEYDSSIYHHYSFSDTLKEDNPINQIPDDVLIQWCEHEPEKHYALLVSYLQTYSKQKDSDLLAWEPIIFTILQKAPNIQEVLSQLEYHIRPISWSGSHAEALAKRFLLFDQLADHPNAEVREWTRKQYEKLQSDVALELEDELKRNKETFERFEY